MNSSSGGNSSSGNPSSQFVFGGEFRLRGAIRLCGIRLRNSSSGGVRLRGAIHLREIRLRNPSSGGIRLRGAIRLRNSSSEFVFVCGWKGDTRTAGSMLLELTSFKNRAARPGAAEAESATVDGPTLRQCLSVSLSDFNLLELPHSPHARFVSFLVQGTSLFWCRRRTRPGFCMLLGVRFRLEIVKIEILEFTSTPRFPLT